MKTYKKIIVSREVEALDTVICNRCKRSIKVDQYGYYAGGTVDINTGYGSRFDLTLSESSIEDRPDLCDDCIEWFLKEVDFPGTND